MTSKTNSRYLTEIELDTLVKLKYPSGLIIHGLVSELLETPRLFRDLVEKFAARVERKNLIFEKEVHVMFSRLYRLWIIFNIKAAFPIFKISRIEKCKAERIQKIISAEYKRLDSLIDKKEKKVRKRSRTPSPNRTAKRSPVVCKPKENLRLCDLTF